MSLTRKQRPITVAMLQCSTVGVNVTLKNSNSIHKKKVQEKLQYRQQKCKTRELRWNINIPNIAILVINFYCILCYDLKLLQRIWMLRIFYISNMI